MSIKSNEYISVNGFIFKKSDQQIIFSNKILEHFICPIGNEPFTIPVQLNDRHIYDRENILNWLSKKNIDPLTDIEIKYDELKLKPIIEYYLALLCLEYSDNDKIIFHSPYGSIDEIIKLATHLINNDKIKKSDNTEYKYKDDNNVIYKCKCKFIIEDIKCKSLDIRDYILKPYDLIKISKKKKNILTMPNNIQLCGTFLTLYEIINNVKTIKHNDLLKEIYNPNNNKSININFNININFKNIFENNKININSDIDDIISLYIERKKKSTSIMIKLSEIYNENNFIDIQKIRYIFDEIYLYNNTIDNLADHLDLSYMVIKQTKKCNYNNYINTFYIKTHFDNITFYNCKFEKCVFYGGTGNLTFNECIFINCIFLKNKINIIYDSKCKYVDIDKIENELLSNDKNELMCELNIKKIMEKTNETSSKVLNIINICNHSHITINDVIAAYEQVEQVPLNVLLVMKQAHVDIFISIKTLNKTKGDVIKSILELT